MVALREQPPVRMTLAEFFAWDPDDASVRHWQLIDGEPVAMAPAAENHGALLRNHVRARGRGCRVISEAGIIPRFR
jgi:Uma2 family endonuclease